MTMQDNKIKQDKKALLILSCDNASGALFSPEPYGF